MCTQSSSLALRIFKSCATVYTIIYVLTDSSEEALEKIYANLQLYLANNLDPVFNAFELGGIAAGGNTTDAIEFNQSKDLIYIVHYLSEIYYNIPIRAVASIRSSQNSAATYFYLFDYVGKEGKLFTISDENLQGNCIISKVSNVVLQVETLNYSNRVIRMILCVPQHRSYSVFNLSYSFQRLLIWTN